MCGIVAYIGKKQAAPILLEGLEKLEYRGYDSAGIAVRNNTEPFELVKSKGRLKALAEKTDSGNAVFGTCGIGHTRWATHGEPSEGNAHPHISDDGTVVGVHNGIIENYREIKGKLLRHGYQFYSETDTEIAIKLVDYYLKKYKGDPVDAIARAMARIRGSYALVLMFASYPQEIYAARKDSPLIIGVADDATYAASDVPAILKYTRDIYYIENLQIAKMCGGTVSFYDMDQESVTIAAKKVTWDAEAAEKNGYEHFMIKEIHEQPQAVQDTLHTYIKENHVDFTGYHLTDQDLQDIHQIYIVACGSAYHIGVAAQYVIEDMVKLPVRVELASEFRYRTTLIGERDLVIVISQSGETADSLAALRLAKEKGAHTLGIVNVVGSSISREADHTIYTSAGPEISVATTKAYSAQLAAVYALSIKLARIYQRITEEDEAAFVTELQTLPAKIAKILEDKERLQWFAAKYANAKDMFFIGRGIDYAVSLEGSLKMKEISYIHSEAYAAGELKHGTISLIEPNTLVVGICTQKELYEKTLSNMTEVKSRGAYVVGVTSYGNYAIEDSVDFTIYIPKTLSYFTASLAVIPLQLLGYYVSVSKGLNVDKPRNLAKSVTVE